MKPKSLIVVFLSLIICLLILGFLLWKLRDVFKGVNNIDATPLSEFEAEEYSPDLGDKAMISGIEGNAEFKFPSSSRDIYAYTTGFQDIFIQTRFTIDAEELQEFISSTRCEEPLQRVSLGGSSSKINWWKLSEAKTVMGCSGSTEHFGQMVYIDMTNPETYIVYVEGGTH
jgi:hypothetical protein